MKLFNCAFEKWVLSKSVSIIQYQLRDKLIYRLKLKHLFQFIAEALRNFHDLLFWASRNDFNFDNTICLWWHALAFKYKWNNRKVFFYIFLYLWGEMCVWLHIQNLVVIQLINQYTRIVTAQFYNIFQHGKKITFVILLFFRISI